MRYRGVPYCNECFDIYDGDSTGSFGHRIHNILRGLCGMSYVLPYFDIGCNLLIPSEILAFKC